MQRFNCTSYCCLQYLLSRDHWQQICNLYLWTSGSSRRVTYKSCGGNKRCISDLNGLHLVLFPLLCSTFRRFSANCRRNLAIVFGLYSLFFHSHEGMFLLHVMCRVSLVMMVLAWENKQNQLKMMSSLR